MDRTNRVVRACLLCVGITGCAFADFSAWQYNDKLYLNTTESGAMISRAVNDFPLLVRLSSENFPFAQAQPDGADIRFAGADGSMLSYQIEHWDASAQTAAVWVLVDAITPNSETQHITMYWGNASASDASDGSAVFGPSQGYQGVFHLKSLETAENSTGDTEFVGLPQPSLVLTTGIIGMGLEFPLENISDNVQFHNHPFTSPLDTWTWSLWIKPVEQANQAPLLANFAVPGTGKSGPKVVWGASPNRKQKPKLDTKLSVEPGYHTCSWYDAIPLDQWHHVVMVGNMLDSTLTLYVNGQQRVCKVDEGEMFRPGHLETMYFSIGSGSYTGMIDEVQLLSQAVDSSWVALSYASQKEEQCLVTDEPATTGTKVGLAGVSASESRIVVDAAGNLYIAPGLVNPLAKSVLISAYSLSGRLVRTARHRLDNNASDGAIHHRLPLGTNMPLIVRLESIAEDGGVLGRHTATVCFLP